MVGEGRTVCVPISGSYRPVHPVLLLLSTKIYEIASGSTNSAGVEYYVRMSKCTMSTLPFGTPSTVRGSDGNPRHIDWSDHRSLPIGHKHIHTGGRYCCVYPFQIDVRIPTLKEFDLEPPLALPSANHVRPPSKLHPIGMSLGGLFCSAATRPPHMQTRIVEAKLSRLPQMASPFRTFGGRQEQR